MSQTVQHLCETCAGELVPTLGSIGFKCGSSFGGPQKLVLNMCRLRENASGGEARGQGCHADCATLLEGDPRLRRPSDREADKRDDVIQKVVRLLVSKAATSVTPECPPDECVAV